MILCTRCGELNPDDAWSCSRCGHKLQSLRRPDEGAAEEAERRRAPLGPLSEADPFWRRVFFQCLEVCALGAALLAAVAWGLLTRTWWPAGVVSLAAAVFLLVRRRRGGRL